MKTNDPFFKSMFESLGNYNYLIATICLLCAVLCVLWYPRAKRAANDYKRRQLIEYNKNRPNQRKATDYAKTKLYLPLKEKMKLGAPVLIGVMFVFMAITFFAGHSIQTL